MATSVVPNGFTGDNYQLFRLYLKENSAQTDPCDSDDDETIQKKLGQRIQYPWLVESVIRENKPNIAIGLLNEKDPPVDVISKFLAAAYLQNLPEAQRLFQKAERTVDQYEDVKSLQDIGPDKKELQILTSSSAKAQLRETLIHEQPQRAVLSPEDTDRIEKRLEAIIEGIQRMNEVANFIRKNFFLEGGYCAASYGN